MALTKKQKVMVPLIAVALLLLVYEVISTFSNGDNSSAPAPSVSKRIAVPPKASKVAGPTTPSPIKKTSAVVDSANNLGPQAPATPTAPKQIAVPQIGKVAQSFLTADKHQQMQYVDLLNAYQLAQVRKLLSEANASIATSDLKTVKAKSEAEKYVPVKRLGTSTRSKSLGPVMERASDFRTLFVGYRRGRWYATIEYKNRMYNVNVGDEFPDGTQIRVIDRNGVVVQQGQTTRYLTVAPALTAQMAVMEAAEKKKLGGQQSSATSTSDSTGASEETSDKTLSASQKKAQTNQKAAIEAVNALDSQKKQ